jgi:subfamily B ATP-binding cassette protein MsbA
VFALRGIGSYVSEYGMAYTGHRVVYDLRRRLIDKLLALPTPFYDQTAAGVVQSKVTFDAHQLASAASGTITTAVRSSLTIAASFGWLMWLNWRLTLLTFVVLPVVGVTIRYFSRRLRRIARDIQTRTGGMTHVLEELIGGHRIVRIFGGESYERERAGHAANALRVAMTKQSAASAASSPLTQGLAAVAVGLIIWAALDQSQDGRLDLPTFTSYVVALITLLERLKALSGINASIQRGLAATARTSPTTAPSRSRAPAASSGTSAFRCATPGPTATRSPTCRSRSPRGRRSRSSAPRAAARPRSST